MIERKYIYVFGPDGAEGNREMRDLLGGKGANLAEMAHLKLPVPPGFTITTEACRYWLEHGALPPELPKQIHRAMRHLERTMQRHFGHAEYPLLVSVRSGAPVSMPGMMDTILNLGLNHETVEGLVRMTGNLRFAHDCWRRFIAMFADVVLEIDDTYFEDILTQEKRRADVRQDFELTPPEILRVIERSFTLIEEHTERVFPRDPWEQLSLAIEAVFRSWKNPRAIMYREQKRIPEYLGTSVTVQAMVFGNFSNRSGTIVAFTRNPSTGEAQPKGEFLLNAQGEDVVAGVRTPESLEQLAAILPEAHEEFLEVVQRLEKHFGWPQDIEATIEEGHLWLLQTRDAQCEPEAAVKFVVDLAESGALTRTQALLRIDPRELEKIFRERLVQSDDADTIATGIPASTGTAKGYAVFSSEQASAWAHRGIILVREETSAKDLPGMIASRGLLTARGGFTSHAAVVARGMGKPAVVGCSALEFNRNNRTARIGKTIIREGMPITIDGSTGRVFLGLRKTIKPIPPQELFTLLSWADEWCSLEVWANADTPEEAVVAQELGAKGIGLCRTEHMFREENRIPHFQKMILSEYPDERREALAILQKMQKEDFKAMFRTMADKPLTIRLLDPPLHEVLPSLEDLSRRIKQLWKTFRQQEEIVALSAGLHALREEGLAVASRRREIEGKLEEARKVFRRNPQMQQLERMIRRVETLEEANPMLGTRGCRLLINYPEIVEVQTRAIFEAACELVREGLAVQPDIMIPMVSCKEELLFLKEIVSRVASQVMDEQGIRVSWRYGSMIELPAAALSAKELATVAEFFSFGSNDLTQTTLGFSRDDAGPIFALYRERGIHGFDPSESLDPRVEELMTIALQRGRSQNPKLKVGICGEHGGDPRTIEICHKLALDYVSASPYRIPGARIAAAQAAIRGSSHATEEKS